MKRLLLGSGGLSTDERRQAWIKENREFLQGTQNVLFVPYALKDHDRYLEMIRNLSAPLNLNIQSIHQVSEPRAAIESAEVIYVGGGNTFRLLNEMYRLDLLSLIRERVLSGELRYIGISAGSNMACPTVMTTNDMPIVMPPSFKALDLVPFQINPHYFSGPMHIDVNGELIKYGGETRDDRIREFHEMNDRVVIGIREGAVIRVEGNKCWLGGVGGGRVFRPGKTPEDMSTGAAIQI